MLDDMYFIVEDYDPVIANRFFRGYRVLSDGEGVTVYDSKHPVTRTPQSIMVVERDILSQLIDAHLEGSSSFELKVRTSDR